VISLTKIRARLNQILHLHESPHRTALAFSVGVFIAFSPSYGFHTLQVLFCTWAFRLNFLALMAGAFINNPWTIVPILGATVWTGFQVLDMPQIAPFDWNDLSLGSLYHQILPYLFPFLIGGVILSVGGMLIAYPIAYWLISRYRAQRSSVDERLPT
jgi:uncharacterized protein